jgi:hypothetical protein
MHTRTKWALCILFFLLAGCSAADSVNKFVYPPPSPVRAVSDPSFNPRELDKVAIIIREDSARGLPYRLMEDEFITALIGKGYKVPSRSDMKAVVREIDFQRSALTDADAAKIGKMMNVRAVMIVSVTNYDSVRGQYNHMEATLSARLVGVEKSDVLWIGTHSAKTSSTRSGNSALFSTLARRVASAFPAKHETTTDRR